MQAQMSLNISRYFVAIMTFISEFLCFRAFLRNSTLPNKQLIMSGLTNMAQINLLLLLNWTAASSATAGNVSETKRIRHLG